MDVTRNNSEATEVHASLRGAILDLLSCKRTEKRRSFDGVARSPLIVPASIRWVKGAITWRKKPILLKKLNMLTTDPKRDDLRASVIDRFAKIASAPDEEKKFPIGPQSAKKLGYDPDEVDALPSSVTESFCGVGNPFLMGEPQPNQTILDLGCGAGFDTLLAARRVEASGKVIGVDMTLEMIVKARTNAGNLGLMNVEFILGEIEDLPLPVNAFDLVISNGVFNLCPDKPRVLHEVLRVLKPNGRLQMADILLEPHVTAGELATKGSWSD
jgi:SAM-dependent methyltransferase